MIAISIKLYDCSNHLTERKNPHFYNEIDYNMYNQNCAMSNDHVKLYDFFSSRLDH